MPEFVVLGRKCNTDGNFSLNDLPGSTGRLDILLRCVTAAFFLSGDIRRDVQVHLVLQGEPDPPKTVRFSGSELRYLNPDERSTAALVRTALMQDVAEGEEVNSTPGVYVSRKGLPQILEEMKEKTIVYLMEDGEKIRETELENDIVVILGGQVDPSEEEEKMIMEMRPKRISLGPNKMHASHCITVVLNELDNR